MSVSRNRESRGTEELKELLIESLEENKRMVTIVEYYQDVLRNLGVKVDIDTRL